MPYYVYILHSEGSDRYYIGHTNDVLRRVEEHNTNPRMTYTHKYRPWQLKTYCEFESRGDSMKIEKYIKRMKSRKVIERLISDKEYFNEIAQLVGVPTCRD